MDSISDDTAVCIAGGGPAGLLLAVALAERGHSVVLIEAGGANGKDRVPNDSAENHGAPWHGALQDVTFRALGGTLHLWGGRCVPLDRRDVEPAYTPGATGPKIVAWPVSFDEIDRYQRLAAEALGCEGAFIAEPLEDFDRPGMIETTGLERWSPVEQMRDSLTDAALREPRIRVLTGATVVDLASIEDGGEGGRVVGGLVVRRDGEEHLVRARHIVLAAGGIETTRLMLVAQQRDPGLFGGPDGQLGRYYMGHLTGSISSVVFESEADRGAFDFIADRAGQRVRRRFSIDPERAASEGMANIVFWVENLPRANPLHRSALRSARFLVSAAGAAAVFGDRRLASAHARNLLWNWKGSVALAWKMISGANPMPHADLGQMIPAADGGYALRYHAEHLPDTDNRITLGDSVDANGVPRVRIKLRFGEQDVRSIVRAHDVLFEGLTASGRASMRFDADRATWPDQILTQACDGFHQIGTTRMSASESDGVVDADLRVHGTANLHVASTSVFPTSGQCNPTLPLLALTLRLADRLHERLMETPFGAQDVASGTRPGRGEALQRLAHPGVR